jgi:hypothetical protein
MLSFLAFAPWAWAACSSDDDVAPDTDAGADVLETPETSYDVAPAEAGPLDAGPCADAAAVPDDLFCSGLYSDRATKTVAASARAFTPGLTFWSDGADKSRWIYLPPGGRIDTTVMDEWVFPAGTKVWKEFRLGAKRIETRLLAKVGAAWIMTVYRWSADETSARRMDNGESLDGGAANGGTYEIPPSTACPLCHNGHEDKLLGIEAFGLGLSTASGVTLATLKSEGRLTNPPATDTTALPEDTSGKAASALGWLHVNCGVTCHSTSANATGRFTGLKMRVAFPSGASTRPVTTDTDTYITAVNQVVQSSTYTTPSSQFSVYTYRIAKNDLAHSLIPAVAAWRGPGQMPPVVTHVPDTAGLQLVKDWIVAMP